MSPAKSEKQRRFMGAELGRKRAGKKTKTDMSEQQLREYAAKGDKMKDKKMMMPKKEMNKMMDEKQEKKRKAKRKSKK